MPPLVSVIIPARNAFETIDRAVISAVNCGADKVLVYDDNSTDKTRLRLDKLYCAYPQVQVFTSISSTRAGCSFARNFLINRAPHGLIVPLDADDALVDLKCLVAAYSPNTWVYGDYLEIAHDDSEQYVSNRAEGMIKQSPLCFATMLFHKDDWSKAGGYDTDFAYAEDYGFQCALTQIGIHPKHVKTACYKRFVHKNERTERATTYWRFYHQMAKEKYHFA